MASHTTNQTKFRLPAIPFSPKQHVDKMSDDKFQRLLDGLPARINSLGNPYSGFYIGERKEFTDEQLSALEACFANTEYTLDTAFTPAFGSSGNYVVSLSWTPKERKAVTTDFAGLYRELSGK